MKQPELTIEDEVIDNVLKELEDELVERVYSKDLVDCTCTCASTVINHMKVMEEKDQIKKDIIKAFVVSNWTQRVYFIVRSVAMTIMGAIITLAVFWQLGTVNVIEDFLLGVVSYLISLSVTRLFDNRIVKFSENVLVYLDNHVKLRDFVVKKF